MMRSISLCSKVEHTSPFSPQSYPTLLLFAKQQTICPTNPNQNIFYNLQTHSQSSKVYLQSTLLSSTSAFGSTVCLLYYHQPLLNYLPTIITNYYYPLLLLPHTSNPPNHPFFNSNSSSVCIDLFFMCHVFVRLVVATYQQSDDDCSNLCCPL